MLMWQMRVVGEEDGEVCFWIEESFIKGYLIKAVSRERSILLLLLLIYLRLPRGSHLPSDTRQRVAVHRQVNTNR